MLFCAHFTFIKELQLLAIWVLADVQSALGNISQLRLMNFEVECFITHYM